MKKQFLLFSISFISAIIWLAIFSTVVLAQPPAKKLPDLKIESILLGKDCNIIIELKNNGPGKIPDNVWTVHSPQSSGVLLYKDGKRWGGASIWKIDPKKALQKPGGTVLYESKLQVLGTAEIKATVDETKQVKEINEKNNITTKKVVCHPSECDYDLAANIKCELISKRDNFNGRIKITGIVKNVGKKVWRCSASQARTLLEEKASGARSRVIKSEALTRLNPNQTITLEYSLDWYTANEFPPDYTIRIDLDPDILKDQNPENDDCNSENNHKELKATTINNLF